MNLYEYADNNPLNEMDPNGLCANPIGEYIGLELGFYTAEKIGEYTSCAEFSLLPTPLGVGIMATSAVIDFGLPAIVNSAREGPQPISNITYTYTNSNGTTYYENIQYQTLNPQSTNFGISPTPQPGGYGGKINSYWP